MTKKAFHSLDSVLIEGFSDKDATPPNSPSAVIGYCKIGIFTETEVKQRIREQNKYDI